VNVALVTSARAWRGSTNVFAAVGRGLAARGMQVVAVTAHAEVAAGFAARGLEALRLPTGRTGLRGARALRRTLGARATGVVLADKPRDVRLAAYASLGRPRPLAVVYCISTPHPPTDPLTRLALRRVRLTVFLAEELARRAIAAVPFLRKVPYRVIPNGVDCDLFRPDAAAAAAFRRLHALGAGPLLVGVGALAPEKRWDVVLDAVALLPRPAPPLVLCGAGRLEGALRAQAQRLSVELRCVGWLEPPALVGAYNAATCIVHGRPDEVFSLALIEALACGRPVLAANGGGTEELVGTAGVLAAPGDARDLARLLAALLGDAPRREALGAAARHRAVERYSLPRMVRDYVAAVESLG
jgi:glycosyltransferase involved in cell wall biosynthesis